MNVVVKFIDGTTYIGREFLVFVNNYLVATIMCTYNVTQ